MATRGRPKGVETRILHVRIPVTLHRDLEILQVVTEKTTSDVVRGLLERYVLGHEELLAPLAAQASAARKAYSQSAADEYERGHIEFLEQQEREEEEGE